MTEPSLPVPRRLADRVEWRLSAHFFRAMFDFGVLSEAGADSLKHLFVGSIGGFVSAAWLMVVIYADKYLVLRFQPSPEPYRRALLGDDMFMLGVPMLVGAFVTLLVSSSLFPDERDFRILGPLPIHRGVVFGAKMAALVLFVGAFIALTDASLLPLFLLTTRNPWGEHVFVGRLVAWLATSAAASAFAILAVAAGAGLLGLLRSSARLQGVTTTAKSLALGLLVLSVPLVVRLSDLGGALEPQCRTKFRHSGGENSSSAIATSSTTWSKVRGRAARKKAFSFANACSIGLKSGLYGGRKRSRAPTRSIAACTAGCLCIARLSSTTTSPGCSVGTRTCSTYARKVGLSIGPSKTAGAVRPSTRKAATTVWVCQWPHGV